MAPKVAIIYYSMYGHIRGMAEAVLAGIKEAGGEADLLQVQETLPGEVLALMHAPAKSTDVIITPEKLAEYDAFLFGVPTRFGSFPAQWKTFWDSTGGLWTSGALYGKYAGFFVSSASSGGGQETTIASSLSVLAHHGIIYVPLGGTFAGQVKGDYTLQRGGSAWGAGTLTSSDGSRLPSDLELGIAKFQGKTFYSTVSKVKF